MDLNAPGGLFCPPGCEGAALGRTDGFERVLNVYEQNLMEQLFHAANRVEDFPLITPDQVELITLAKKRVGLNEEGYRRLLFLADGAPCAEQLTADGFRRVMRAFEILGFVNPAILELPAALTDQGAPKHSNQGPLATVVRLQPFWRGSGES